MTHCGASRCIRACASKEADRDVQNVVLFCQQACGTNHCHPNRHQHFCDRTTSGRSPKYRAQRRVERRANIPRGVVAVKNPQSALGKRLSQDGRPLDGRRRQYIANHADPEGQNNCARNASKFPGRRCKHKPGRQVPRHVNPYRSRHERNFCIPPCGEPRYYRMSRDQRFGAVKHRYGYGEKNGGDQSLLGYCIYTVGIVRVLQRSPRKPEAINTTLNNSMLVNTSVRNGVIANR